MISIFHEDFERKGLRGFQHFNRSPAGVLQLESTPGNFAVEAVRQGGGGVVVVEGNKFVGGRCDVPHKIVFGAFDFEAPAIVFNTHIRRAEGFPIVPNDTPAAERKHGHAEKRRDPRADLNAAGEAFEKRIVSVAFKGRTVRPGIQMGML